MNLFSIYSVVLVVSGAVVSVADVASNAPEGIGIVLQYGGLGAMLLWFAIRVERRMEKQVKADENKTAALRDMAESMMVSVLAMKNLDSNISELAQRVRDRIQKEP